MAVSFYTVGVNLLDAEELESEFSFYLAEDCLLDSGIYFGGIVIQLDD